MSLADWAVFAGFWALFVATPGPNAANCVSVAMRGGFARALPCVAAILCQAALFLALAASGVAALLVAAPPALAALKVAGAGVLILLGVRGWRAAGRPLVEAGPPAGPGRTFGRAFLIATVNAKSVAGYVAAFTQFVRPDVPIPVQMGAIVPTAMALTATSYTAYCAMGAALGRAALGAIGRRAVRRGLAGVLVVYGALLGASALPGR